MSSFLSFMRVVRAPLCQPIFSSLLASAAFDFVVCFFRGMFYFSFGCI